MNATTTLPATPKQIGFLKKLAAERPMWADVRKLHPDVIDRLDRKDASRWIDEALKVKREVPAKPAADQATDGMYRTPDGRIFKVQVAVHGSKNLYAKELVGDPDRGFSFQYAAGWVRKLRLEWKMTLAEAKAWGALYGTCCVCGRTLTNEESIEAGIGPICASKF